MPEIEVAPPKLTDTIFRNDHAQTDIADLPFPPENIQTDPEYDTITSTQDKWTRSFINKGLPYYITKNDIGSKNEKFSCLQTSWTHPEIAKLLESFRTSENKIKYSAYRTAFKLRGLQSTLFLNKLTLYAFEIAYTQHGYSQVSAPKFLTVSEVEIFLATAFTFAKDAKDSVNQLLDVPLATELTLNWLIECYDSERNGHLSLTSLRIGIICMCVSNLQDKYEALFHANLDNNREYMLKNEFLKFIEIMLCLPTYIGEGSIFGLKRVPTSYSSFLNFSNIQDDDEDFRVSLNDFMSWMRMEPQYFVWLSTLHRVATVEFTKHTVKCNICKTYPILGFRFRCQKCSNFDICQDCFFLQRTTKSHKITHPIKEYALPTTTKEDVKDFAKTMRNKISLRYYKRAKAKQSFLKQETQTSNSASNNSPSPFSDLTLEATNKGFGHLKLQELSPYDEEIESHASTATEVYKLRVRLDEAEARARDFHTLLAQQPLDVAIAPIDLEEIKIEKRDFDSKFQEKRDKRTKERMDIRLSVLEDHNRSLERQLLELRKNTIEENKISKKYNSAISTFNDTTSAKTEEDELRELICKILEFPEKTTSRSINNSISLATMSLSESFGNLTVQLKSYLDET